ncbi:MAG: Na+/H+ antiporter NhaC family protein [Emcibacteraceae bacterium]
MESYGVLSVIPPLLSVALAIYTRNIILALTAGALSGTLILNHFNPFFATVSLMRDHRFVEVSSPSNTQVILITLIIGGFVNLLEQSGGAKAFSSVMVKLVSNKVKGQLATWLSGISVFFSDTANSLIVGPLFRPVFRELKICREKLAYIIDTTAAPVVILVPVASWGVYIMSLIENSYSGMGVKADPFSVLLEVWPYQFYAFLALFAVPMFISTGKDFGPMAAAQKRFLEELGKTENISEAKKEETKLIVVILPFAIMAATLAAVLGYYAMTEGVKSVHVNAGLCLSYLFASMGCAYVMKRYQQITYDRSMELFFEGVGNLISVGAILALAWALSSICRELETGQYLATLIGDSLNPRFFPIAVFIFGAMMSFATGSSFGTFAILMATTLPVAHILGADLILTIAAILSGGLFGDHTSPISDTTVLASMGAGCPHIDHVSTQFPYAMIAGFMTVLAFLLLAIFDTSYIILVVMPLQYIVIRLIMRRYGS